MRGRALARWVFRFVLGAGMTMSRTDAAWAGGEIGFVEDYVLAPDRTAALRQLIPGTEDHFYYQAPLSCGLPLTCPTEGGRYPFRKACQFLSGVFFE